MLKDDLKTKKLQQKIPISNERTDDLDIMAKLKEYCRIVLDNSNIKQKESKLKSKQFLNIVKIESKESEIKLLKSQLENYKDQVNNLENLLTNKDLELKLKEKENTDIIKSNKTDISRIMDELAKIKEKWVPPERFAEKMDIIANLEKIIKSLKEDIERKKELLTHYKNGGSNEELNNKIINLQDKVKEINSDILKKDATIKTMKSKIEEFEDSNRKLLLENSSLHNQVQTLRTNISTKDQFSIFSRGENNLDTKYSKQIDAKKDYQNEILVRENENLKQISEDNKQRLFIKNDLCERLMDVLKKIYQDLSTQYEFIMKQNAHYYDEKSKCMEWKDILTIIDKANISDSFEIAEIFIMLKEKIIFNYKMNQRKETFLHTNDKNLSSSNQSYRDYNSFKLDKK